MADGISNNTRVKACNACRQHKLRCDHRDSTSAGCSRCRKMGRECIFTTTFKRRSRQTKADLQREIDALRAQQDLQGAAPRSPQSLSNLASHRRGCIVSPTAYEKGIIRSTGAQNYSGLISADFDPRGLTQGQAAGPARSELGSPNTFTTQQSPVSLARQDSLRSPTSAGVHITDRASHTSDRTLGAIVLAGHKIQGCYETYMRYYAPLVQGLFDQEQAPDELYDSSVLLFWTVVYVGSRGYQQDPTILESIMTPLKSLLYPALFDPECAISTIQAAVLICMWPFPVDSTFKDPSHAIAGAAMHLAVQKGIPYAARKQDFARVALTHSAADRQFRARLWAYSVITFQGTSLYDGLPCPQIPENASLAGNGFIVEELPSRLRCWYQECQIQSDAIALILKEVDLSSTGCGGTLDTLVAHFDTQLVRLAFPVPGNHAEYRRLCARLFVRLFHFFSAANQSRDLGLLSTYSLACDLLRIGIRLDGLEEFGRHACSAQSRMAAVAALCILRIIRSPIAGQVDHQVGEEVYFATIRLFKKRSMQNTDVDARLATILTQLWSSTKAFKLRDGTTNGLRLFLRSRLTLSVLYDSLWWWRAEFGGGGTNPYLQSDRTNGTTTPVATVGSARSANSNRLQEQAPATMALGLPQSVFGDLPDLEDWQLNGLTDWDWQEMLGP